MTIEEAAEELLELKGLLLRYQREYYVEGRPSVADVEYDRKFDRLLFLEREFPELVTSDSPSHRVGSDLDASFPEVPHTIPVLSLDKAYTAQDVASWMEKTRKTSEKPLSFVAEEKIDGVSIVLYYEAGALARAVTRGNGYVGNDVTANVKTIRSIPLRVSRSDGFAVRGEIFLPVDRFEELNAKSEIPYVNPRNLASGTLRRNKSSEVAKVPLRIFVYEGFFTPPLASHREVVEELSRLGFPVNPRTFLLDPSCARGSGEGETGFRDDVRSPEDLPAIIEKFSAERAGLRYQIDGLVFKVNELDARESLGFTGHHPRWAIAYKFESPEGLTRVAKIEIQIGRTGRVTPVARVEPVEVGGATIVNVTLHNQDYIDALELSEGDTVAVSRRGDVIPAVERVVEKNEEGESYKMPEFCPSCGSRLVDRGAHRFCPNSAACPDQRKGRLVFFAGKGQMDIENLGAETIDFLWNEGLVDDIPDLYRIPYEKLKDYPGFGDRKVDLIRQGVEKSLSRPFEVVLPSLGIPEIGTKVTEILVQGGFDSIDKLIALADSGNGDALLALHGIGEKTAERIMEEFKRPELRALIAELKEIGLKFTSVPGTEPELPRIFEGQSWCVTGSFEHYKPRDLAMDEVKKRGGKVVSAVSGATTHLLAGEGAGSKLEKARALGVKVVTEEEFLTLLSPPSL